MGRLKTRKLCN